MNKNIHETAIIAAGAKIADDVKIGPYCIIGPQVSIDSGTVLESHVVVEGETIIGKKNYIFSFVSIGKVPQDLKFHGEETLNFRWHGKNKWFKEEIIPVLQNTVANILAL